MAIVQAESLLDRGGVDGADLFDRFRPGRRRPTTSASRPRGCWSGRGWETAARDYFRRNPNSSAGNGALMRATPTAVHFALAAEGEGIAAAHGRSSVTHGDPAAGWGTALYHVMIRAAPRGRRPVRRARRGLALLPDGQARYVEMLDASVAARSRRPAERHGVDVPGPGRVGGAHDHGTFADAVIAAIDLGGDTDTVAAVTGGLAGAIHGIRAIPSRWTTYLHGR